MSCAVNHLVVMGVSGSGKTTAANNLHDLLGWPVAEADDFHPRANVAKMSAGIPLTDEDRWPWLGALRQWMDAEAAQGRRTIVTCSALKRSYRDFLSQAEGRVFFVHLAVAQTELAGRLERRSGHFMPATLLPSQMATLESLQDDEDGATVVSCTTPEETVQAILSALHEAEA